MAQQELATLADSVLRLAEPGMKPKALLEAVRKEHPKATKKDVVRAAFYAVIVHSDKEPERSARLHGFALTERLAESE